MLQMMLVFNAPAQLRCVCGTSERVATFLSSPIGESTNEFKGKLFEDQLVGWPFTEVLEPAY